MKLTPKSRDGTATDLVVARYQRLAWAAHLALCELGPMMPQKMNETDKEYLVRRNKYLRDEHDLRMAIANRLN